MKELEKEKITKEVLKRFNNSDWRKHLPPILSMGNTEYNFLIDITIQECIDYFRIKRLIE